MIDLATKEVIIMALNKGFSLYTKINDFNNYIRKYIVNDIPNIHRDIRIHLLDECFNLTKNMLYASYNKGNIRMKYLIELKVNISVIDILIGNIREFKNINNKYLNTAIIKLSEIKDIIYGWIINEEKKKNQKYL